MDINLNTPINSLGYGVVGYNIYKNFIERNDDITLWEIGNIILPIEDQSIVENIKNSINKQSQFNPDLPCLKIFHENHLATRIGRGKYVAYPFFEISNLDQRRYTHLQSTDAIVVASQWAKDILLKNKITVPIYISPCGVDRTIFGEQLNLQIVNKCIFLNCGKWEIRKGHDILIRAFREAFKDNEPVELLMMTSNPFLSQEETNSWKKQYLIDHRVKILERVQYQNELANIMQQVYCGVFPSRAEGWNLELLEMMSMGKFCIATNYSAHTEFCNKNNCDLIEINEEEPMYDGKWFFPKDGVWASLNGKPFDQLVSLLRYRYEEWLKNPIGYNIYGIQTAKEFSWDNCINKIKEVLE